MVDRSKRHEAKKVFFPSNASPGRLYKGISVERPIFQAGQTKLERPVVPRFVRYCKWCAKSFSGFGGKKPFSPEYKDAVEFLGWDLKSNEFSAAITFSLLISLIIAIALGFLFWLAPIVPDCTAIDQITGDTFCELSSLVEIVGKMVGSELMAMGYLIAPLLVLVFLVFNFIQKFPLKKAKEEEIKALTYVPEVVGYLTMSMKLVPNLEKAVEFAALHGRGKIATDFQKLIWDVQLGVYNTLSEGLDALAYRWGKFSEEFKRSLMMVRASVLEDTEAKRFALLDKTMEELLDSIKNKMEQYARDLSQPAVFLFYLGVLLPLILIIVLPIGSAFTGQPLARTDVLIIIYNIIIPIAAWMFAHNIIKKRPPTYEPPVIPDNHPELPPKWKMKLGKGLVDVRFVVAIILVAGLGISFVLSTTGLYLDEETPIIGKDKSVEEVIKANFFVDDPNYFELGGTLDQKLQTEGVVDGGDRTIIRAVERQKFFSNPENDITPYNLLFGGLLTVTFAAAVGLYYRNIYKRKMQANISKMESEFKDSLYILASRMGENKPVEEALEHTRNFLPNTLVADRVYGKTVNNIHVLGLPLESALFDPNYGSMKNLPSNIIVSSMKLLVDSVRLGVNVSARTLISLSLQLTNAEKVSRLLVTLVQEITTTMQTTAVFIAPLILGVTTSLQKIVVQTLLNIVQETSQSAPSFATIDNPALQSLSFETLFGQTQNIADSLVSPAAFILIVGFYVAEIVFIMTYFNTKIQEDNDTLFRINFAKAIPIAIVVFIVSVIASNSMITLIGG
ncbi:hypothetical protein KKE06_01180 [Candidatus Micrarchaeota archaeon]|nr:hypothetical protein [Candidatus Micrarchaeota archaeon]MBU1930049.1 hypothetical protein [Candidatus Micrarchaeota archaeon]